VSSLKDSIYEKRSNRERKVVDYIHHKLDRLKKVNPDFQQKTSNLTKELIEFIKKSIFAGILTFIMTTIYSFRDQFFGLLNTIYLMGGDFIAWLYAMLLDAWYFMFQKIELWYLLIPILVIIVLLAIIINQKKRALIIE
jgi:hypothetical protein